VEGLIERAVRSSFLAEVPEPALASLLERSIVVDVPKSSVLYRSGDPPRLALIVDGLVRVYLAEPAGTREVTVRYARRGDVMGVTLLGTGGPPLRVQLGVQALSSTRLLFFDVASVRALARGDARVAGLLGDQASRDAQALLAEVADVAFGTVRQRLARHLLDVATVARGGESPIVHLTQQELADAVGTARQVVTRALDDLRLEGILAPERGQVRLLDTERLFAEVEGLASYGTRLPDPADPSTQTRVPLPVGRSSSAPPDGARTG